MIYQRIFHSPVGILTLSATEDALCGVAFGASALQSGSDSPLLLLAEAQLTEYFDGRRRAFDLPLAPAGTSFQKAVWAALQRIPYGEVRTYAQIAQMIEHPKACRAVGMANHNNPIAIMIPCHRVIGANGSLTGYAGGLDVKRALLALEGNRIL